MEHKNHYDVLGISEQASADEIKKAYRKLAKDYHPDTHPGDKVAEAKFKEVSEAHDVLAKPEKRAEYDRMRKAAREGFRFDNSAGAGGDPFAGFTRDGDWSRQQGAGGFEDLFGSMFDEGEFIRGHRSGPRPGGDIYTETEIPIDLAVLGGKTGLSFAVETECAECHGTGVPPGTPVTVCSTCRGSGLLITDQGEFTVSHPCPACAGRGSTAASYCGTCHGAGAAPRTKKISVTIPAGIGDGENMRLRGLGEAGLNGGPAGDLYIRIRTGKHPFFRREGMDIRCEVTVNVAQAVIGSKVRVKTVRNQKIQVSIPAGTQPGTVLRLRNEGIRRDGISGDMLVEVRVRLPQGLTPEEAEFLRRIAEKY